MEYVTRQFQELLNELGPDASGQLTLAQKIEVVLFFGVLPNQDGSITKPDHPNVHEGSVTRDGALMTWKNSVSFQ